MADDSARKWTDKELFDLESRITETYDAAKDELTSEWDKYMARGQKRLKRLYNAYLTASPEDKAMALSTYQNAVRNYTFMNNRYNAIVGNFTQRLTDVNKVALDYVNNVLPGIYAHNYNHLVLPQSALDTIGIDYTLVDESTVRRLLLDGDIMLPQKTLNIPKDMLWNTQQLNKSVLTGLLLGEDMKHIAQRILPIVNNNKAAAIRNARTMVTGAENQGRQDRYVALESQGAVMHKVWIATPDHRVRDWHLSMDGQEVDADAMFTDGLGNRLKYPGDPTAPGNTVYNCRCSMRSKFVGMRRSDGTIKYMPEYEHNGLHQTQIDKERKAREGK